MLCRYERTIFKSDKGFCIFAYSTSDESVPKEARNRSYYHDDKIHFTAIGYHLIATDAVEVELDAAAARVLAALQAHRRPVARYDSYPQPGGINPPLRLSPVGGGVPDAPQVSSNQREGRRAACPQAAAAACVPSQFHCAACGLPAKGRLPYTRGPGMPGPYHIVPGGIFHPGLFSL